jgi:protein-tyrosine phosphatase
MIDIHCHILHGVDDGAKDLEESVEMARISYVDGIRDIIVTPHFNDNYQVDAKTMMRKLELLQLELDRRGVGIRLHPGNEVRLESKEQFEEDKRKCRFAYLGTPEKFLLLEQRWESYNRDTAVIMDQLLHDGITPIIPHPERHYFFREQPDILLSLIERGAWTQVSADSLVGNFGPEAATFGGWLCSTGNAHTVATDAHNVTRKPNLSEGMAIFTRLAGEEAKAELLARTERIVRGH